MTTKDDGTMRGFDSGATRDTVEGKLLYHLFLSPVVLTQYAKFMSMNRLQSDGNLRDGDNWQKGIPMDVYESSMARHYHELWTMLREQKCNTRRGNIEKIGAAMGLLFNVMGYVHEWLEKNDMVRFDDDEPTFDMRERQEKLESLTATEAVETYHGEDVSPFNDLMANEAVETFTKVLQARDDALTIFNEAHEMKDDSSLLFESTPMSSATIVDKIEEADKMDDPDKHTRESILGPYISYSEKEKIQETHPDETTADRIETRQDKEPWQPKGWRYV